MQWYNNSGSIEVIGTIFSTMQAKLGFQISMKTQNSCMFNRHTRVLHWWPWIIFAKETLQKFQHSLAAKSIILIRFFMRWYPHLRLECRKGNTIWEEKTAVTPGKGTHSRKNEWQEKQMWFLPISLVHLYIHGKKEKGRTDGERRVETNLYRILMMSWGVEPYFPWTHYWYLCHPKKAIALA